MLSGIRRRLPFTGRGHGPWIVVAAVAVALLVTPFALAAGENRPLRGGARNPSSNASLSFSRETQIIANNSSYGTRQSNKSSTGGGAIYGCRARTGANACLRASNLSNGRAFSFATNSGAEVGRITKTWEGLARTMFTTADHYVVQIHKELHDPLRSLVVASALCVDTALKQDARGFN